MAVIFVNAWFEEAQKMKRQIVGLLALLALIAMAKSDKMCEIEGVAVPIPDAYDCEKYVKERIESFRFPTFPWIRFPPILSTLLPLFPRWPTTPGPDSDENEFECPDDDIELIPHPYDCEKYVLCVFGERIKRRCAEGLEFSPEERTCMLPEDAECKPQDRVWECPEEDDLDNLVFLPNKEDCSKYYLCWDGEQIPLACAKVSKDILFHGFDLILCCNRVFTGASAKKLAWRKMKLSVSSAMTMTTKNAPMKESSRSRTPTTAKSTFCACMERESSATVHQACTSRGSLETA